MATRRIYSIAAKQWVEEQIPDQSPLEVALAQAFGKFFQDQPAVMATIQKMVDQRAQELTAEHQGNVAVAEARLADLTARNVELINAAEAARQARVAAETQYATEREMRSQAELRASTAEQDRLARVAAEERAIAHEKSRTEAEERAKAEAERIRATPPPVVEAPKPPKPISFNVDVVRDELGVARQYKIIEKE